MAVLRGDEGGGHPIVPRQGRVPLGLEQLSDMRLFFEVSSIPRKWHSMPGEATTISRHVSAVTAVFMFLVLLTLLYAGRAQTLKKHRENKK